MPKLRKRVKRHVTDVRTDPNYKKNFGFKIFCFYFICYKVWTMLVLTNQSKFNKSTKYNVLENKYTFMFYLLIEM